MDDTDWLMEYRRVCESNRKGYEEASDLWREGIRIKGSDRERRINLLNRWAQVIKDDAEVLVAFAKALPATQASIKARLLSISVDVAAGRDIREQICLVAADIAEPSGGAYLGSGQVEIDGKQYFITAANDQLFIETLLNNGGAAMTSTLEKAGVSNPSTTAKRLIEWEAGILANYIETPGKVKGKGYRTTIVDARK